MDVDVTRAADLVSTLMEQLQTLLHAIAGSLAAEPTSPKTKAGRLLPLIAMPLIGTKYGGLGSEAGAVVRELLKTVKEFTDHHPVTGDGMKLTIAQQDRTCRVLLATAAGDALGAPTSSSHHAAPTSQSK